jgi:hypothetical protein
MAEHTVLLIQGAGSVHNHALDACPHRCHATERVLRLCCIARRRHVSGAPVRLSGLHDAPNQRLSASAAEVRHCHSVEACIAAVMPSGFSVTYCIARRTHVGAPVCARSRRGVIGARDRRVKPPSSEMSR